MNVTSSALHSLMPLMPTLCELVMNDWDDENCLLPLIKIENSPERAAQVREDGRNADVPYLGLNCKPTPINAYNAPTDLRLITCRYRMMTRW